MKRVGLFLLLVVSVGLVPFTSFAATVEVHVNNFFFDPATVTINQGDTVRWDFQQLGHTTTSGTPCTPDGKWDSGTVPVGQTFEHVFPQAGTFPYFCMHHCFIPGGYGGGAIEMRGTVVVTPAPAAKIEFNAAPHCAGVGIPVTINAESTLGGQFFKYWVNTVSLCGPGNPNWQVIKDWSTDKTATWVPTEAGIHTVIVWNSNTMSQTPVLGQLGGTFEVGGGTNCLHSMEVNLNPTSGTVNEPVTITGTVEGTNRVYRFWMNNVNFLDNPTLYAQSFQLLRDWGSGNTFSFTPTTAGVYTLIVWATSDINDPCVAQAGAVYQVQ